MNKLSALIHALQQADARHRALSEEFEILKNRSKNIRNRLEGGYINDDDYSSIEEASELLEADEIALVNLLAESQRVATLVSFIKSELAKLEGGNR